MDPVRGGDLELPQGRFGKRMTVDYRICTNCVMDTSDSKITFGPDGVCDHCQTFYAQVVPSWDTGERGRAALERITAEIKKHGAGRDFDCIIGVSGGIDSSYLTYIAKTKLDLRPLVFDTARARGWPLRELTRSRHTLEDLFVHVIRSDQEENY